MLKKILLCFLLPNVAYAADIVTSIRPLYDLASQIVADANANANANANDKDKDKDKVHLLLKNTNPHDAVLKPSHIRILQQGDVIFYMDDGFEIFMKDVIQSMRDDAYSAKPYPLARQLHYLVQRDGHEEHAHHHHGDDDEKAAIDFHLWLAPKHAIDMVTLMRDALLAENPKKAVIYQQNSESLIAELHALDARIKAKLAPYRNKPFIVFHDGYQYFEKTYQLTFAGALTLNPEQPLSPKNIRKIRDILQTQSVHCIFVEPEFATPAFDKIIASLAAEKAINIGMLDPLGNLMQDYSYQKHLTALADNAMQCLK
ncbi:MAG: zinc ABC transporter substrate-binding protein [Alphaproteobacteria bacterium]|nr:zinc ABC transporter substrate-binding protein [Alphaproteobacteria bacterium]